jgi:hypothetical protein
VRFCLFFIFLFVINIFLSEHSVERERDEIAGGEQAERGREAQGEEDGGQAGRVLRNVREEFLDHSWNFRRDLGHFGAGKSGHRTTR